MRSRIIAVSMIISSMFAFSYAFANADTLSASCTGASSSSNITWTGSTTGGIAPITLLWGNGASTSVQTVSYTPGVYSMTFQATDASSSVATTTCSATVASPTQPSISSFIATPSTITAGHSSVLSWTVANASSTSIDNSVGTITGTSVTVSPAVTTTYHLTAVNPNGTVSASATVTVNTTTAGSTLQQQIAALLQQIAGLQQQIKNLISGAVVSSGTGTTTPNGGGTIPPGQIGKLFCIGLNRDLGIGSHGDDVMSIQQMLAQDPDSGFTGSTTGFFGQLTAQAMARWQVKNGIASSTSGFVGSLTRGFFERRCGKGLGNGQGNGSSNQEDNHGNGVHGVNGTTTVPAIVPHGEGNGNEKGNGRGNGRGRGN